MNEIKSNLSSDGLYLVFNLNHEYHGLYEDDHCYFTYLNVNTREFVDDYWTTAGACPAFSSYERPLVKVAIENGLITAEEVRDLFIKHYINNMFMMYSDRWYKYMNPYIKGMRVESSKRSRLFKGTGYLVDLYKYDTSFGWKKGYSIRAHVMTEDGTICSATLNQLYKEGTKLPVWEAITSAISAYDFTEYARTIDVDKFFEEFYQSNNYYSLYETSSYSRWDWSASQLYISTVSYIMNKVFTKDNEILSKINTALYNDGIKNAETHNKYIETKRNGLYSWMKEHITDIDEKELNMRFERSCANKGYVFERVPEFDEYIKEYKHNTEKYFM